MVSVGKLLILIAVIVFVLAAFGLSLGSVGMLPLGLAFLAAGFLVP